MLRCTSLTGHLHEKRRTYSPEMFDAFPEVLLLSIAPEKGDAKATSGVEIKHTFQFQTDLLSLHRSSVFRGHLAVCPFPLRIQQFKLLNMTLKSLTFKTDRFCVLAVGPSCFEVEVSKWKFETLKPFGISHYS